MPHPARGSAVCARESVNATPLGVAATPCFVVHLGKGCGACFVVMCDPNYAPSPDAREKRPLARVYAAQAGFP